MKAGRLYLLIGMAAAVVIGAVAIAMIFGDRDNAARRADTQVSKDGSGPTLSSANQPTRPRKARNSSTDSATDPDGAAEAEPFTGGPPSADELAAVARVLAVDPQASPDDKIKACLEFVKRYPFSKVEHNRVLQQLVALYEKQGQLDKAKAAVEEALRVGFKDPEANYLRVTLARLERQAGNNELAEQRLREVIHQPLPKDMSDPSTSVPQLVLAPMEMSNTFLAQGRRAEAIMILRSSAERGLDAVPHQKQAKWLPEAIGSLWLQAAKLQHETKPDDHEALQAMARELKARLPDYTGAYNANDLQRTINDWTGRPNPPEDESP